MKQKGKSKRRRAGVALFLYLALILTGCDFRTPEAWEMPKWTIPISFPLLDTTYYFQEIADDSLLVVSETDSILQIEYIGDLLSPEGETLGIDDSFNNYFVIPDTSINEIADVELPPIDFPNEETPLETSSSSEVSISSITSELGEEVNGGDCFPDAVLTGLIQSETVTETLFSSTDFQSGEVSYIESIDFVTVDSAEINISVENTFPFPIDNIQLVFESNGNTVLNTGFVNLTSGSSDTIIYDYCSTGCEDVEFDLGEDISITWQFQVDDKTGTGTDVCEDLGNGIYITGWDLSEELSEKFNLNISVNVDNIKSVTGQTSEISYSDTISIVLPQNEGVIATGGRITSDSVNVNSLNLGFQNSLFTPINFTIVLPNFEKNGENISIDETLGIDELTNIEVSLWDAILKSEHEIGDPIDSIKIVSSLTIPSTSTTIFLDNIGGLDMSAMEMTAIHLEYISAIVSELEFDVSEFGIEGIPTGFTGISFYNPLLTLNVYNEIGVPVSFDMNLVGVNSENIVSIPINPNIQTPELFGDSAKHTYIELGSFGQRTVWYDSDSTIIFDETTNTDSTIVDILKIAPEIITVEGLAGLDGVGFLAPNSKIWGSFELIVPFSFVIGEQIIENNDTTFTDLTFIPDLVNSLNPLDETTRVKIDSSIVSASITTVLTNNTPISGSLSLLISDHDTYFPIEYDSPNDIELDSLVIDEEIVDSIQVVEMSNFDPRTKVMYFLDESSDTLSFIGRMVDIEIPAPYSIVDSSGIVDSASVNIVSVELDSLSLDWFTNENIQYIVPMITFNSSEGNPITLQSTNNIGIEAFLTFTTSTELIFKEQINVIQPLVQGK